MHRVLYSFKAVESWQCSVTRGELVGVLRDDDDSSGWARCRRSDDGDRVAYFPAAFARPQALDIVATATKDFVATNKSHLAFRRADRLVLLQRIVGYDWWHAAAVSSADATGAANVGRVPIVLLHVDANHDEFARRAALLADPTPPSAPPSLPASLGAASVDFSLPLFVRCERELLSQREGDDAAVRLLQASSRLFGDARAPPPPPQHSKQTIQVLKDLHRVLSQATTTSGGSDEAADDALAPLRLDASTADALLRRLAPRRDDAT